QFTFFLADVLQVVQARPKRFRTKYAKLLKDCRRPLFVCQDSVTSAVLHKIRLYLTVEKLTQRRGEALIRPDGGSEGYASHRPGRCGLGSLLLGGVLQIALQGGTELRRGGGSLLQQLAAYLVNLFVNCLHGNTSCNHARNELLQNRTHNSADHHKDKEHHQCPSQGSCTKAESRMKQNEGEA